MNLANLIRQHWAALRALLVLTVITGFVYPLVVWGVALLPGLHAKAEGSIVNVSGKPVGSKLIGQLFTDKDGNPLPQYFQSRPSAAGKGYDPLASGPTNLGPESIVDTPADPTKLAPGADPSTAGFKPSLLTQVCTRSVAIGKLENVDGSRPFCTGGGVGAVLSVIGPRDASGNVIHPTQVVSVNEPCSPHPAAHRPRSSSSSTRACGCNAPNTVRTTRRVRSCPFAARRRITRRACRCRHRQR